MLIRTTLTLALACFSMTAPLDAQLIVAHRGASTYAPENTLPAFELAWKQNADAIEADFHLTADGVVTCIHDRDTKKVTGIKMTVAESNWNDLKDLDAGSWKGEQWKNTRIPRIEEVLATVPAGKKIYVEVKSGVETVGPVIQALDDSSLGPEQAVIISFHEEVIREFKNLRPDIKAFWLTGYKVDETTGRVTPTLDDILATLKAIKANGLGSNAHEHIDQNWVDRLKKAGYEFHCWTINDEEKAKQFKKLGAQSITTDVPDKIRKALE